MLLPRLSLFPVAITKRLKKPLKGFESLLFLFQNSSSTRSPTLATRMESSGRKLRSGGVVPAAKSPTKPPKQSTKARSGQKPAKAKANEPKGDKAAVLAKAIEQAEAYLAENDEEDAKKSKRTKRAREEEQDEEIAEEEIVAEAEALSAKLVASDKYLKELDSRRTKALDDTDRYKQKAALARATLRGSDATKKGKEIKKKLAELSQLLVVIRNLTAKRQDAIYAAALREITEAKHAKKKRRTEASTLTENSEDDGLDVSEGESPFLIFQNFSMPRLSPVDQPTEGDRPLFSNDVISSSEGISGAFSRRYSHSATNSRLLS